MPIHNAQEGIRCPLVYEYRSGTPIPGVLAGSFLPIASEKAITLSEYLQNYSEDAIPTYNLPGEIVQEEPEPPAPAPERPWVLRPTVRWVIHRYNSSYWGVGRINEYGEFIPNKYLGPPFDVQKRKERNFPEYNVHSGDESVLVYEYRAGLLAPGWLGQTFIPTPGERPLPLADYLKNYNPKTSRPIYNLPGEIVRKADSEGGK